MSTRVAVIGIGRWGYNHIRAFESIDGVTVGAVCDLDEAQLARARNDSPSIVTTIDPEDAIRWAEVVVIASSAKTHFKLAKMALKANRHVLVEKPLALDVKEGSELVDLAEREGRILMVGHLLLYHPAFVKLQEIIAAGDIGKPLYCHSRRLNLGRIRKDENVLWSLAPHDISMANAIFGSAPEGVSASGSAFLQDDVHDIAFLTLKYSRGRMAHTHVSWLDPHKARTLTVVGDEKMVVFDDMESTEKLKIYDMGAMVMPVEEATFSVRYGDIRSPRVPPTEPLRAQAQHFIDCVREGKTPRTDGVQGLDVLRVLEAANWSLARVGVDERLDR